MIKCLTFDLDDTLWDVVPVIQHMDKTLYQWLQQNAPKYTNLFPLEHFSHLRKQVAFDYPQLAHSVTSVRLKGLEIGMQQAGYTFEQAHRISEQGFVVALEARQKVSYFPHTWQVLQLLKQQGFRMGAITNGNADIHRVGLSDYFDFQLNAHEVGVEKPDPHIFEMMLQQANLLPTQVIHIGDNPVADVWGAQQLGIASIWVNVIPQQWTHEYRADRDISCLSELPEAVASIVEKAKA